MRQFIAIAFVLAAILASGCADTREVGNGMLEFSVTSLETGQPIEDAGILIERPGFSTEPNYIYTGADGTSSTELAPFVYRATVAKTGMKKAVNDRIIVVPNQITKIKITLAADNSDQSSTIETPVGQIPPTATDQTNQSTTDPLASVPAQEQIPTAQEQTPGQIIPAIEEVPLAQEPVQVIDEQPQLEQQPAADQNTLPQDQPLIQEQTPPGQNQSEVPPVQEPANTIMVQPPNQEPVSQPPIQQNPQQNQKPADGQTINPPQGQNNSAQPQIAEVCGNAICEANETPQTCKEDCKENTGVIGEIIDRLKEIFGSIIKNG